MSGVKATEEVFDRIGNDDDTIFLYFRVGVGYLNGEAPKSAKGVLRFPAPSRARYEKLYFVPLEDGERLGKFADDTFCSRVEYWRDQVFTNAPYGELFLKRQDGAEITFGRFGEDAPFRFNKADGKHHIALVTPFAKNPKFNPLYMRVEIENRPTEYYVLDIDWGKEAVIVSLLPVPPEDCPEFLVV